MEEFVLNLLESIGSMDFQIVWQIFAYGLIVFWFVVLYWVWLDSGDRTSKKSVRWLLVLLVAILNVVGLVIYLIIRPPQTIEEIYWSDLERRYLKYETAELGDCPKCGSQLFPGFNYCPSCRYKIKIRCTGCQVLVDRKHKFCPHCGQEMRKRKSSEQTSPTKEVMQQQIDATKEEAKDVVESKKTRYSSKKGFALRIGESVVGGYEIMYTKLKALFSKSNDRALSKKSESKQQDKKKSKNREKKEQSKNHKK